MYKTNIKFGDLDPDHPNEIILTDQRDGNDYKSLSILCWIRKGTTRIAVREKTVDDDVIHYFTQCKTALKFYNNLGD